MDTVTRNVSEISSSDRRALEHVIGHSLHEKQQIIIQVVDAVSSIESPQASSSETSLPSWCQVYAGLTDDEIASLDSVVLQRADMTRSTH